ncbi:MAG: glycosyltransferase [Clostridia bacterium]|nr:glycosyltransferase [Clostridia bacterium]
MTGTVIYVGNFELPDKNAAAHRVVNNARLFRSLGLDTVFLGTSRADGYFDGYRKTENGFGFDMYERCYPRSFSVWARQIFDVGDIVSLAKNHPDTVAVITYNTQYATAAAAKRAFAPKGVKVIYDCTEWNSHTEGNAVKRAVKAADSKLIENRLPRACDGIIAVSTVMQKKYAGSVPLLLLPPLVDTEDGIWRQPKAERDRFTFCYAGSPSDKDRLDILINCAGTLPEDKTELRVIGVSREEYTGADVPGNVTFLGRLPHRETVREILGCGCFVFLREPTRRNIAGFPTKFAEAFTCGVPIITTDVSDIALYADEGCTVLKDISADSVRAAMAAALSSPAAPAALRRAFDFRSRADACRAWFERITCSKE